MTADARASAALVDVEARIDAFFDEVLERVTRHSPHYHDLWTALRASASGGKRLRPRLTVAAYLHLGGEGLTAAIDLATGIELLHTALLLHDDVIDGDVERRGAPNLVGMLAGAASRTGLAGPDARQWGESAAILAGDLLLTAALRLCATVATEEDRRGRLIDLVDESVFRAAAGELADVAYAAGLGTPTPEEIRRMMADKTAHYSVELPLRAGAILAGASREAEDRLGAVGNALGILFQLVDDLLGVFGRRERTGKSIESDLRSGKQTMLVAFARGTSVWADAEVEFGNADLDPDAAERLRAALVHSGARRRFEEEIRRQRDETLGLIAAAGLPQDFADYLVREVGLAVERDA